MMNYLYYILLVVTSFTFMCIPSSAETRNTITADEQRIYPDYSGITIPPNIAPLNFLILDSADAYSVDISSQDGAGIHIRSRSPRIQIPEDEWSELLARNKGNSLLIDIKSLSTSGGWSNYCTLTNRIAQDKIDDYLFYRLLNWQFSKYSSGTMGIYQRNVSSFDEDTVLRVRERKDAAATCLNCHTFLNKNTDTMALHIRNSSVGKPMLMVRDGAVYHVDQPAGLLSWHPSGEYLAYSVNFFAIIMHSVGYTLDVFDFKGDLKIYQPDQNITTAPPQLNKPDLLETWPEWSPDGRYIYFCRATKTPVEEYDQAEYNLMRAAFDPVTGAFKEPEIFFAPLTGFSIAQPKVSPDGKFMVFCMIPYGSWPVTQPKSELYLMNMTNREYKPLDTANSPHCESYHSWSSNGKWLVFSSKRLDGLLSRPFITHIDAAGKASKPFVIPQENPEFYKYFPKTYNVPELAAEPIKVTQQRLFKAVFNPERILKPRSDSEPPSKSDQPAGEYRDVLPHPQ
ncbi:MAG: hypothetical protein K9N52_00540 [Verrucomicrobia bacterium]|nr:hypothetical protein [Verrucomicrobiota bacterium]